MARQRGAGAKGRGWLPLAIAFPSLAVVGCDGEAVRRDPVMISDEDGSLVSADFANEGGPAGTICASPRTWSRGRSACLPAWMTRLRR